MLHSAWVLPTLLGAPLEHTGRPTVRLDRCSSKVRIASTLEPSASVNLEYLMLALKADLF